MFDKLTKSVLLLAVRGLTKEIRSLRLVAEELVDTTREIHGVAPKFRTVGPDPPPAVGKQTTGFLRDGDFLTAWILEGLAREAQMSPEAVEAAGGIERVAVDRGWVTPGGEILVVSLEAQMAGVTVDQLHEVGLVD